MYKNFVKRVLDIILSLVGLPFFIIILIVIGPVIYFEDKGPVFYAANRVGKNCKIFKMYKFRSMKVNAPNVYNADGSTFNSEDDPRQTKIGKILRKTSLDEVPQIINVLIGDMSFIGPRPPLEEQLCTYSEEEKGKMQVRPGITGYNQAYFRNQLSTHKERMQDVWYAKNVSFLLDIKILFKTAAIILLHENVYKNDVNEIPDELKEEQE